MLASAGHPDVAVLAGGPPDWAESDRPAPEGRVVSPLAHQTTSGRRVELGLRQNAAQFALLVAVNALGGMLGQERTVLPLLGQQVFGIRAYTAGLSFILVFGVAKAATNYFAGTLGPIRPQTRSRRGLARRGSRAAAADLGTVVVVGHRRQRAARHQPGIDLVHHRGDEDRPGGLGPARPGDGSQRGRGLRRGRGDRTGHRRPGPVLRPAPGAVPAGDRVRGPRPGAVDARGEGDPRARPARGRHSRRPRRRPPRPPARRAERS